MHTEQLDSGDVSCPSIWGMCGDFPSSLLFLPISKQAAPPVGINYPKFGLKAEKEGRKMEKGVHSMIQAKFSTESNDRGFQMKGDLKCASVISWDI